MIADNFLELCPGDIVVVATQLQDGAIAKIKGESKVPEYFDSRPVQMDYYPSQLVRKLRERGVFVAFANLSTHPELSLEHAASKQKHQSLEGFLTRISQDTHRDSGVQFFDLFEGMRSQDWVEDGQARHPSKRKYLPAETAQPCMVRNIWKAVAPFLEQKARSEPLPELAAAATAPNAALAMQRVSAGVTRDVPVSFPETGSEYNHKSGAVVSCRELTHSRSWGIVDGAMGCWHTQPPPLLSRDAGGQPVAAFDFDNTLASCDNFKGDANDWTFLTDGIGRDLGVRESIRWLHDQGYLIVVMSNNSVNRLKHYTAIKTSLARKFGRIENLSAAAGVPIVGLAGLVGKSRFHKPGTGMWDWLCETCEAGGAVRIDRERSFYVGDAAGRGGRDFADTDKGMAWNAGLPFFTETEFFNPGAPPTLPGPEKRCLFSDPPVVRQSDAAASSSRHYDDSTAAGSSRYDDDSAPAAVSDEPSESASAASARVEAPNPPEEDVDDYEVKGSSQADDNSHAVVTQASFKAGEDTRDHEWMLELEEMVLQEVTPPNAELVKKLMLMAKICDVGLDECNPTRDKYRAKALKLAALKLKGHPQLVRTEQEVEELLAPVRGVGPKTTRKVVELVTTGTMRRLDDRLADPQTTSVLQFTQIFGVGPMAAKNFYEGRDTVGSQQLRTLDELRDPSNPAKLKEAQLWWLERLDCFNQKIPRREVEVITKTVEARCKKLFGDGVVVKACGSYRRGLTMSSDVDLLLSHRDGETHKGKNGAPSFIAQLLDNLRGDGIVTRELMAERQAPHDNSNKDNVSTQAIRQFRLGSFSIKLRIHWSGRWTNCDDTNVLTDCL